MIIGNKKAIKVQFFEGESGGSGTTFSSSLIATNLAKLTALYEKLDAAVSACAQAGADAVAAGGPGVGGAINEAIVTITAGDLATVRAQLEKMQAQFAQVQAQYANKNAELIASIKAIARAGAETAAGGTSTQ